MLLVLPPSETKRDGGAAGSRLELSRLSFPELTATRTAVLAELRALSRTVSGSMAALGLGPTQRDEIERNRSVARSAVLPALDRYTGVLYDALEATSLTPAERAFAHDHLIVHSALFGLVRALDPIPAYRLSHDSRLPARSLRSLWRVPVADALARQSGLILDVRSEAYAALGPRPEDSWYLRVVTEDARGRRVALSHFNKKAKGEFVRALVRSQRQYPQAEALVQWGQTQGIRLAEGRPGELDLVVATT